MIQIKAHFPQAIEMPQEWQAVNESWLHDQSLPWLVRVQQIDTFIVREADATTLHFAPFVPASTHFLADWLRTAWLGGTPLGGRAYTQEGLRERLAAGRSALVVEPVMDATAPNARRIWLIEPATEPAPAAEPAQTKSRRAK